MRRIEDRLRPHQSGERHGLLSIASAAPLPLATVLVYAFIEGASFALMPVWALDRGLSPEGAAALVGIWLSGNILLQIPLGWLADHMPRARVIAGCALLSAAGLLLLPCVAVEPERVWLLLVPLGGLMGGLYTLGLTLLGDRFQGASLTTANTAFVMTFQIGMITGPPIVGAAMQGMGAEVFPLALLPPLCILACVAALPSRRAPVEGRPTE
jgi:MFS family permease